MSPGKYSNRMLFFPTRTQTVFGKTGFPCFRRLGGFACRLGLTIAGLVIGTQTGPAGGGAISSCTGGGTETRGSGRH